MTGVEVLLAVLLLSTAYGVVHRARSGRVREAAPDQDDLRPVLARLGEQAGERATLLQFSSAFCAPCRATRRVLGEVAAVVPGVRHVEVDAEAHLDVVRELGISSTPTTLVLDAAGRVTARATGQPRKDDVLAALAGAVP
ncbi:MAG TPA: thioredoxin family protein [Mycobacteriales bacterium]|nr:thioredoxin family protein [Mycobacteriales bacterium]